MLFLQCVSNLLGQCGFDIVTNRQQQVEDVEGAMLNSMRASKTTVSRSLVSELLILAYKT